MIYDYPVYLNLKNKKVLVVGGGKIGFTKAEKLLEAGAEVTVISKTFHPFFERLKGIRCLEKAFETSDPDPYFLVIAATGDPELNKQIFEVCDAQNKLVNVVDQTDLCRFIVPAKVACGELLMTLSTGGRAPFLTKSLAQELRNQYGDPFAAYVKILGAARDELKKKVQNFEERLPYFQKMLDPRIKEYVLQGKVEEAEQCLNEIIGMEKIK